MLQLVTLLQSRNITFGWLVRKSISWLGCFSFLARLKKLLVLENYPERSFYFKGFKKRKLRLNKVSNAGQ